MRIDDFHGEHFFLSNFFVRPLNFKSDRFGWVRARSVEHVYQAEKANSKDDFFMVLNAGTPGASKRLGRNVAIREDWEYKKARIMWDALQHKFSDPVMADLLLSTGDAKLVEGNTWHDQIWGDCSCGRPACADEGGNWLGKLLTELRKDLLTFV